MEVPGENSSGYPSGILQIGNENVNGNGIDVVIEDVGFRDGVMQGVVLYQKLGSTNPNTLTLNRVSFTDMKSEASLGLLGDADLTDVTITNGNTGILACCAATNVTLTRVGIHNPGNYGLIVGAGLAVDIVDSTFDGSHSTAISSGGDVTIRGSTVSNSLRRAITNQGVMSITNSTISGNSATSHDLADRGIISNSGTLNLTHVTIANNTSGPPAISGPNVYPVTGGIYNAGERSTRGAVSSPTTWTLAAYPETAWARSTRSGTTSSKRLKAARSPVISPAT